MYFKETYSGNSKKPVLQLIETVRTDRGPRQLLVVSLGTYFNIPKSVRREVARIVKERLQGQISLFFDDTKLLAYADKIVKKIQIEGKWNAARKQAGKLIKGNNQNLIAEVFVNEVTHGYSRELGPFLIGHTFWKRLKFSEILSECGFNNRQIKTAEISILNRLIAPGSENAIIPWLNTVAVEELLDIDISSIGKDRFYNIADKLLRNHETIEEYLYKQEKHLFALESSIFLYDLTNTYFEGSCASNPKARYSKNQKEKRSDCPQIVVALVLDGDGFIRRHRIFNGKMTDMKSLKEILSAISDEFKDSKLPTIIFDRGMVSDKNLGLLKECDGLKYIVMCRSGEEAQFEVEFTSSNFIKIKGRGLKPAVKCFLTKKDNISYLLCKSEGRKIKEQSMRTSKEKKLETELENLKKQIIKGKSNVPAKIEQRIGRLKERYSKVAQYYEIGYTHWHFLCTLPENILSIPKRLLNSLKILMIKTKESKITLPALKKRLSVLKDKYPEYATIKIEIKKATLNWQTIDEAMAKKKNMEGNYLLKTNRKDLDADSIWKMYTMLTGIENAFHDLKSYLGLRPNFHQKECRVDGHIFITILAYHLLHSIEYHLRRNRESSRWATIKRLVCSHDYSTMQLPTAKGAVINIRKAGMPEGIQLEIYKKLGIDIDKLPVKQNFV